MPDAASPTNAPYHKKHRPLPPGPRGLPLIGTVFSLAKDPLGFLLDLGHNHGPVSFTRFGPTPTYMLNDPELIEEALVGKYKDCIKDKGTRDLSPLVGSGLLTSEGEAWRRQRKIAAPPLQPKRIQSYAETMFECAERAFSALRDGEQRDAYADLMRLTLEIVGKTLLGVDTSTEAPRIARVLDLFMAYFERQAFTWEALLPLAVPTWRRLRMRRGVAELDAIIYPIIERAKREPGEGDTFLARLVKARDEAGQPMSDAQLRDEAVTMLLAGHETTALALSYAVCLLSAHREVAERLRNEVDAAFDEGRASPMQLCALPYLNAVVRETLRLYPPAYAMGREVVTPFEIGGYQLKRGDQLMVSQFSVHRDPRWFPDPRRFLPERWLDPAMETLPKFAFFPFGGGPRICIGNHFALMEIAIVLADLVRQVELEVPEEYQLKLAPLVTLRLASPLPSRVRRRSSGGHADRAA